MLGILMNEQAKIDPRVKRTRALIFEAFNALLAEKGFTNLTIQDITDRAEINRATFYAHFVDKYALLDAFISLTFRQELERRTLNACHYSLENLRGLMIMVVESVSRTRSNCNHPNSHFESLVENSMRNVIQELLTFWLSSDQPTKDTAIPATVATWSIYGLAYHYNHQKSRESVESFVDAALPLVAKSLAAAR